MSHNSPVQCITKSFFKEMKNGEIDKTNYVVPPLISTSPLVEKIPISKKTVAQDDKGKITVTSHFLEQAARRISWVQTPLIVAGNGILKEQAKEHLVEFASCLEIPIASTLATKESIPNAHPLWIGAISSPKMHSLYGFDWVDLVIAVGCDTAECSPEYWNPDGDIPILHISSSSATKSPYYQPTLELVGNLPYLLSDLSRRINRQGKGVSYPLELQASSHNVLYDKNQR